MGTFAAVAADRQYIVGLASSFTTYVSRTAARAAAQSASGGASGVLYYTALVEEEITAPGRCDLVAGNPGPQTWIIQAASTANYLPKSTAEATAFTTSASNSNAGVFVARIQEQCTGP